MTRSASILIALAIACAAMAAGAVTDASAAAIRAVALRGRPAELVVRVDEKAPFRVVRTGPREVIVAFNGGILPAVAAGLNGERLSVERVREDVTVLTLKPERPVESVQPVYTDGGRTLTVRLAEYGRKPAPAAAPRKYAPKTSAKARTFHRNAAAAVRETRVASKKEAAETPAAEPGAAAGEPAPSRLTGGLDDILFKLRENACLAESDLRTAYDYASAERWADALYALDRAVGVYGTAGCGETAYFLRAWCFYKTLDGSDPGRSLEAVSRYQEAMSYFPESPFVAHAMAAIGKIFADIGNTSEASGYFRIVMKSHEDYTGMPQVLLELGRINTQKRRIGVAASMYRKIVREYGDSAFVSEARIELARVLYAANNFTEALNLLEQVEKDDPRYVYESRDLLRYLGNTLYQMGRFEEARDALAQAYNLFPDQEENNLVMTRIGDTYREEKYHEKAQKVFEFVQKKFPGTDGYVISSMRLAAYDPDPRKRIITYKKIIKEFPEHEMSKLASLRLGVLYNEDGKYEKAVHTIKGLLAKRVGPLRKEADYILKEAFDRRFAELAEKKDYLAVISRYEQDKNLLDYFENPDLYLTVGKAYLKGHLFEQAAQMLEEADGLYKEDNRPADLLYGLSEALYETGNQERALSMLDEWLKHTAGEKRTAEPFLRRARILVAQKAPDKSLADYAKAVALTPAGVERVDVLLESARVEKALGAYPKVVALMNEALDLMADAPKKQRQRVFDAWRAMGEARAAMNNFSGAAEAYTNALAFRTDGNHTDVRFLLAESYRKAASLDKAAEVYQQIARSENTFWARLAEEKLKGISLEEKLKQT